MTTIVVVSPQRWQAFHVFNGNAFPEHVRQVVDACAWRFALLLLHASRMSDALQRDLMDLEAVIERQRADLEATVKSRPELKAILVYDGLAHVAEMHNCLNALKSFLDLYAKLIGRISTPQFECGFNKANIDGRKVSGGRLVNALRNQAQDPASHALAQVTLQHSEAWITEAVTYRDQLSHRSNLDHMVPMHLHLSPHEPHIDITRVVRPTMPNGKDLEVYFHDLVSNLATYVGQSVVLFPNVDQSLLSPGQLLERYGAEV
ncbi:MAG TPA: hypothetical protein PLS53_11440 [Thermoanaerobaculaceae bacterium]|nr:hypothetical protein [Thermoanaerobaculaceae bacterium]